MKKLYFPFIVSGMLLMTACGSSDKSADNTSSEVSKEDADRYAKEIADWIDFSDNDGAFSVKLPGKPTPNSQTQPTAVGNIKIEMFLYEESATKAYMVGYNDFPSAMMEDADQELLESMIDGGLDGVKNSIGLDVVDEIKEVRLGEAYGKMIKAKSTTSGLHLHYKAYVHKNRLYQVGVMRDGSYPVDAKTEAFFGSFKIKG